jgi:ribosomal protein S18 acetylase RimI-like enzyme
MISYQNLIWRMQLSSNAQVISRLTAYAHFFAHIVLYSGYPEDEAGTLQAFKERHSSAPELFLGAYTSGERKQLIGYVCATSTDSQAFSMKPHNPSQTNSEPHTVCIHSVCVDPNHRRQGVASGLIAEYLRRLEGGKYRVVLLIAHEELVSFYHKAGFELVGKSDFVHGSKPWFQMRHHLPQRPPDQDMQLRIMQALMEQQSKPKDPSQLGKRTLLSFPGGVSQLVDADNRNKFDILCPRPGCTSVILKPSSTTLIERPSVIASLS